ncbi:cyclin-dependent kinase 10-like protein [Obelidium mucronatum]|nr:cyclin-dependent kinase 10-like protein [Obelidium mucronatum]
MSNKNLTHLTSVSLARQPVPPTSDFFGKCTSVKVFEKLGRVGEGTYGVVYRARDSRTKDIVALKRLRMEQEADGFPLSALREIALLKQLRHTNVVRVLEVAVGSARDDVFMVMEFCDIDLAALMDNVIAKLRPPRFTEREVKCLMLQLLSGLDCLHKHSVIHRDLKMSNLLLTSQGVLKIADFGLARKFADPPRPMTPRVVTLWYRSPEIILGEKMYTTAADMWSVGCIFGELLKNSPLLPGKIEKNQFDLITTLLGFPTPQIWPGFQSLPLASLFKSDPIRVNQYSQVREVLKDASPQAIELVLDLLVYDPRRRIDVSGAYRHPYFRREGPNPCEPKDLRLRIHNDRRNA